MRMGKKSKGLIQQKKQLCTCSTLFLYIFYHCFALLQGKNSQFIHVLLRKRHMYSCSFFFSLALIFTLEAANMCHFLSASIKFFPVFFPTKFVTFVFYLSLQLFLLLPTSVQTLGFCPKKKKRHTPICCRFFSRKVWVAMRSTAKNARVLEIRISCRLS